MISNNHERITHTRTQTYSSLYLVKKNLFKQVLLNSTDKERFLNLLLYFAKLWPRIQTIVWASND